MTEEQKAAVAWAESAIISGFAWEKHVRVLVEMVTNAKKKM